MFDFKKYRPYPAVAKDNRRWPANTVKKAPLWCAVDLRDGNQALIEPMSVEQKQRMWALLVELGFKEIEVGFPSASQPDFDFVRWLIEENQVPDDVRIQALTQARDALIERTYEALKGAKNAIVHVYNSVSPVQREKVFKLDKAGIKQIAIKGAQKVLDESKKYPETNWTFQYSPESFSSTETDYAIEVSNAVLDIWQPTPQNKAILNLPATIECAPPNVFADQVETVCEQIKYRDSILVSVHTHNDRGCAVAAAEMAVLAGADRVEGTLMGNGERTGNMDLVTAAMNLYSQGIDPELNLASAHKIANVVAECTQIATHPRHPWFGELVYTAFSGSHQDAIKKCLAQQKEGAVWDVAYLPIDPKDLGRDYQSVIRVNSQSGKGGVAYILESKYGVRAPRWMQIATSQAVQKYSEQHGKEVGYEEVWEIFQHSFMPAQTADDYAISHYNIDDRGSVKNIVATLIDQDNTVTLRGSGNGAVSAFCNALSTEFGFKIEVENFDQSSLTTGTQAQSIAYSQVRINDKRYIGVGVNVDIVSASLQSILVAINSQRQLEKAA